VHWWEEGSVHWWVREMEVAWEEGSVEEWEEGWDCWWGVVSVAEWDRETGELGFVFVIGDGFFGANELCMHVMEALFFGNIGNEYKRYQHN